MDIHVESQRAFWYNIMKATELLRRVTLRGDEFIKYVRVFPERWKIFWTALHAVLAFGFCKLIFGIQ
jgi:hypothetical protein